MSMESTLWMGDIEPWMNRELILTSFIEYGLKPSSIKMLKDHKNNASRNYCLINFDTMFEANKALIELNGKKILRSDLISDINAFFTTREIEEADLINLNNNVIKPTQTHIYT